MKLKAKNRKKVYSFKRTNSSETDDTIISNSDSYRGKPENFLLDRDEDTSS